LETLRETESTIIAAQVQEISINYIKKKILEQEFESRCRLCKEYEEIVDLKEFYYRQHLPQQ
jgi:hypothetical protein